MESNKGDPLVSVPGPRNRMWRYYVVRIEPAKPARQSLKERLVALESEHPVAQRSSAAWASQIGCLLPRVPGLVNDLLDRAAAVNRVPGP
jgi:hypothetical protein